MAGFLRANRASKGFTLVELMVVVAILAVLMTVVFPAVTGTKSTSTEGQVLTDAESVQKAVDNFQNKGIKPAFPGQALGTSNSYKLPDGTTLWKKGATAVSITVAASAGGTAGALGTTGLFPSGTAPAYLEIDWAATTPVWQPNGTVNSTSFVPDFLLRTPSSVSLQNDEGVGGSTGYDTTKLAEFLWLLKVNNPGSADSTRTVEVFRLTDKVSGKAVYTQVY